MSTRRRCRWSGAGPWHAFSPTLAPSAQPRLPACAPPPCLGLSTRAAPAQILDGLLELADASDMSLVGGDLSPQGRDACVRAQPSRPAAGAARDRPAGADRRGVAGGSGRAVAPVRGPTEFPIDARSSALNSCCLRRSRRFWRGASAAEAAPSGCRSPDAAELSAAFTTRPPEPSPWVADHERRSRPMGHT